MKNILLLLFLNLLALQRVIGQEPLSFSHIVTSDSIGKENLYNRLYYWVAKSYKSSNDVIQMADKSAGVFVLKATMRYYGPIFFPYYYDGYIDYTFTVFIKDDRFKVTLSNFKHDARLSTSKGPSFGLITDSPTYATRGFKMDEKNMVWNHMQEYVEEYSKEIFIDLMYFINSYEDEVVNGW